MRRLDSQPLIKTNKKDRLMKKVLVLAIAVFCLGLTGCAPIISGVMNATVTDDVVLEKTSKYFGVSRNEIKVSSIEKGALATAYKTKYAGKLYNCSIYYGNVDCKLPGA
jgi:hypothetical protein